MSTDPDVHPKQLIENIRAELAELEALLDKGEPLRNLTGFTWTTLNFATILNEQAEEAGGECEQVGRLYHHFPNSIHQGVNHVHRQRLLPFHAPMD